MDKNFGDVKNMVSIDINLSNAFEVMDKPTL